MSPSAVVAIVCWSAVLGLVLYGLSFDVRRGWDQLMWRWDEHRALTDLAAQEARDMALYRAEAAKWGEMASTLDEIRGLPETLAWKRWLA